MPIFVIHSLKFAELDIDIDYRVITQCAYVHFLHLLSKIAVKAVSGPEPFADTNPPLIPSRLCHVKFVFVNSFLSINNPHYKHLAFRA